MSHAENVRVLASWISTLESEFEWFNAVPIVILTTRTAPVIRADYLRE